MRFCVIGAGAAGLASARQVIDSKKHSCVVFEQTGDVGGTWVYTDQTGVDQFGVPIHTSMYKNLRTNLPKEIMGFPDYPIPDYEESYITQEQILKFLNNYTDYYNLRPLIHFNYRVKYIEPINDVWKVTVTDLKNKEDKEFEFDAIMICNGHYHTPSLPNITGSNIFTGRQMHSHDFRDISDYKNLKIVVVGAGPSGMDIALQIAQTADKVYLSHHSKEEIKTIFPNNLIQKPDIVSMTATEVVFTDGNKEVVDIIMYCTGYQYSFPFLDEKSGIRVKNNHVQPLYKHLVNIEYPSMAFIGLPFYVCAFSMFDLQARFFISYLEGHFKLPTKDEMLDNLNNEMKKLYAEGYDEKHAHMMGPKQEVYYHTIAAEANIKPLPLVLARLHCESSQRFNDDLLNFRKEVFRIVDDVHYVKIK